MSTAVLRGELRQETIAADFDREGSIGSGHETGGNQPPKHERDQHNAGNQLTLAPCEQPGSHRPLDSSYLSRD